MKGKNPNAKYPEIGSAPPSFECSDIGGGYISISKYAGIIDTKTGKHIVNSMLLSPKEVNELLEFITNYSHQKPKV